MRMWSSPHSGPKAQPGDFNLYLLLAEQSKLQRFQTIKTQSCHVVPRRKNHLWGRSGSRPALRLSRSISVEYSFAAQTIEHGGECVIRLRQWASCCLFRQTAGYRMGALRLAIIPHARIKWRGPASQPTRNDPSPNS